MSARCPDRTLSFLLVAALAATTVSACGRGRIREVPPELLGVWYTDAPGYRDRWMELRPREIVFATGPNSSTTHPVNGLRRVEAPGHVDFTVYYDNEEGQEYGLEIMYEYDEGGRILFPNQRNMVWRRRAPRR